MRERTQVYVCSSYAVEVRGQFGELVLIFVSLPLLLCSALQARGPVSFWVISPSLPPISRSSGVTDVWPCLSFYVGLGINLNFQACMRSNFTHGANSPALPPWVWSSRVPHGTWSPPVCLE